MRAMHGYRVFCVLALLLLVLPLPGRLAVGAEKRPRGISAIHTVCPGGPPTCGYASIQEAVDAAAPGDEIRVAEGTYTGVQGRASPPGYAGPVVITQVVYISESVTVRGGYTTAFTDPPDPVAHPTTVDAQGEGRAVFVGTAVTVTLEGLQLTGGDATGLGGYSYGAEERFPLLTVTLEITEGLDPALDSMPAGGGIYALSATLTLRSSRLFSNTAALGGGGYWCEVDGWAEENEIFANIANNGGGLWAQGGMATLLHNNFFDNWGSSTGGGFGIWFGKATAIGNTLSGNYGGGIYLGGYPYQYPPFVFTVVSNQIISNTGGIAGGIFLESVHARVEDNEIVDNEATSSGAGLYVDRSIITVTGNLISGNHAEEFGGGVYSYYSNDTLWLLDNTISGNSSRYGGGVYAEGEHTNLSGNSITGNTANQGGGVVLFNGMAARNYIAGNSADLFGGLLASRALVYGNTVVSNTATWDGGGVTSAGGQIEANLVAYNTAQNGGGILIPSTYDPVTIVDTVVLGNQATDTGSGVYVQSGEAELIHTTIAGNLGAGITVGPDPYSETASVTMTNMILVSQSVGITVSAGSQALLDGVLWFANGTNTGGAGVITVTNEITGNPAFAPDGYHLETGSAAIDRGVPSTTLLDFDGDYRSLYAPPDLGADEFVLAPPVCRARLNGGGPVYGTIQEALAASTAPTDLVEVAGMCEDEVPWGRESAVAVLTKTLTVRGGYSLDFSAWDPTVYPTILNGRSQGSVMAVGPGNSPVIEYLTLVGGLAGRGGGFQSIGSSPVLRHLLVVRNRAAAGGGLYVSGPGMRLEDSQMRENWSAWAGGAYALAASVTISGNQFLANDGGGLYVEQADALVEANSFSGNRGDLALTARTSVSTIRQNVLTGNESGILVYGGEAILQNNLVQGNESDWSYGIILSEGLGWIEGNTVLNNSGQGVYIDSAEAMLLGNTIAGNSAHDRGGGIALYHSIATITGNVVISNTAPSYGGGIYVGSGDPVAITLTRNIVGGNAAGKGGGFYLNARGVLVSDNEIFGNSAERGGGAYFAQDASRFEENLVYSNSADLGGGFFVLWSEAVIQHNTLVGNAADSGGGFYLDGRYSGWEDDPLIIAENLITANIAITGGGAYLHRYPAAIDGNRFLGNEAELAGGVYCYETETTMRNNVIADNRASGPGGGLYVADSHLILLHTTVARNQARDGSGILATRDVWRYSTVAMTDTIVASQTVGVSVTVGSRLVSEGALWGSGSWANERDWGGGGTIVTGTVNVWGLPEFADPNGGDYHLGPASAALDAGVPHTVWVDLDGDPRPSDMGWDIGADERSGVSVSVQKEAWPILLDAGQRVTYTIALTSSGIAAATSVQAVDTLPGQQRVVTAASSRGSCLPGGGWGGQTTCSLGTMAPGESARITLTAEITTTAPVQYSWRMRNVVAVTADGAVNSTYADTVLRYCRARLNDNPVDYYTVQAAVDASTSPSDTVKVAGNCVGIERRAGLSQTVFLTKTLTLQGGWNLAFTEQNADLYPTTLDAWGQGRVLYIVGEITPSVASFNIVGGDAIDLGQWGEDFGGGVYVLYASVILSDNYVRGNVASDGGGITIDRGHGILVGNRVFFNRNGGIHWRIAEGTVESNEVERNGGPGLYVDRSTVIVTGNRIVDNYAEGMHLHYSTVTVSDNLIQGHMSDVGGGVRADGSDLLFEGNIVQSNRAELDGGGLYVYNGEAIAQSNIISGNVAYRGGGGMYLQSGGQITGNRIENNSAGQGGGILSGSPLVSIDQNVIRGNRAKGDGGGLFLGYGIVSMVNDIIADNQAGGDGGGLCSIGMILHLTHVTLARNGGSSGVQIANHDSMPGVLTMVDTIVVSHTVGVQVEAGNEASLRGTLWGNGRWANGHDWAGAGSIITETNIWGDPAFVDYEAGDYHIAPTSAAIDAGVSSYIYIDIDDEPRPVGEGYDLGADEVQTGLRVAKSASAAAVRPGDPLTYTLSVANVGLFSLTATITDTLPEHVIPGGVLTWTAELAPGAEWAETVQVTVESSFTGVLTNVVQATSDLGSSGAAQIIVLVEEPIAGLAATNTSPTMLGLPTVLTATVTNGSSIVYQWALGDGSWADGAVVTHTYPAAGVYTATVVAQNHVSEMTATTIVTVIVPACTPVTGAEIQGPVDLLVGQTGLYTATYSPPTATLPVTLTWDKGTMGPSAFYSWTLAGIYTVSVTATNGCGEAVGDITVTVMAPPVCEPIATVAITGPLVLEVGQVGLYTATFAPPTATAPLIWSWSNGTNGPTAVYSWTLPGLYTITLTGTNPCGTALATAIVQVLRPPYRVYLPLVVK